MAERFNDVSHFTIAGSDNLADHLVDVPMLPDNVRTVALTPKDGYSRMGGVIHDATFTVRLYGDKDAGSTDITLNGDPAGADDAAKAGILETEVDVEIQDKITEATGVAGTASVTDPIWKFKWFVSSVEKYTGGDWSGAAIWTVAGHVNSKPERATA